MEAHTTQWRIEGMHCVDCARQIEAAVRRLVGVRQVKVQYLRRRAEVFGDATVAPATIAAAIEAAGYRATLIAPSSV